MITEQMNKKDNKKKFNELITEMKLMLDNNPTLTLESFMMPEEFDGEGFEEKVPNGSEENLHPSKEGEVDSILNVKNEINQIRQIALKTIARLADYPTSESYNMMKKIWNMCDKAMEPTKEGDNNSSNSGI